MAPIPLSPINKGMVRVINNARFIVLSQLLGVLIFVLFVLDILYYIEFLNLLFCLYILSLYLYFN